MFLRTFGCNFRCMNFGLKGEDMRDVKQKREDCERDLAAAIPAVAKAMAALDTITKKDLGELKALKKPPSGVDDVLSAVIVMLSPAEGVAKDQVRLKFLH